MTRPGTSIWATSEGLGWRSVFATAQTEAPFEGNFRAVADHLIVMHLSGPVRVTRTLAGVQKTCLVPPGGAFIMPADVEFGVRLEAPLDTIHFYLRRNIINEIASEFGYGTATICIIPKLGAVDHLLEQIAVSLREQLQDSSMPTALYVDHLARAAGARLLRAHSDATARTGSPTSQRGLTHRQLRLAVEFIEANLHSDPTLADLAAVTGLSPIYFARQFRLAMGLAPHQYLIRSRVARARRLLSASDISIAAVAFDCGFCHQEHLTRVFRKHCGTTPSAYRNAVKS